MVYPDAVPVGTRQAGASSSLHISSLTDFSACSSSALLVFSVSGERPGRFTTLEGAYERCSSKELLGHEDERRVPFSKASQLLMQYLLYSVALADLSNGEAEVLLIHDMQASTGDCICGVWRLRRPHMVLCAVTGNGGTSIGCCMPSNLLVRLKS